MAKRCEHDCNTDRMGLDDADFPTLTGFSSRAFAALAHLREAWLSADAQNARAIEAAIRALMYGHSFADHKDEVIKILAFNHERWPELGARVGLISPVLAGVPR